MRATRESFHGVPVRGLIRIPEQTTVASQLFVVPSFDAVTLKCLLGSDLGIGVDSPQLAV